MALQGSLFLLLPVAFLLVFLIRVFHSYFVSPLASIPNAGKTAPLSRLLWAFITEHKGLVTLVLPELHEKHGPFVRIGPNELSFYSLEVYKTVHSAGSKFVKDPRVYGQFVQDDNPGLFSITDPQEHSKRRRYMGQLFNRSRMDLLQDLMLHQVTNFVQAIKDRGEPVVELISGCRALEADIVSTFAFGKEIGGVAAFSQRHEVAMVKENDLKSTWMPILTNFPRISEIFFTIESWVYRLSGKRTTSSTAMEEYDSWSSTQVHNLLHSIAAKSSPPVSSTPFPNYIQTMVHAGMAVDAAVSEAKEMLGPGTDTTSATLAHILWGLAHDQQYQEELVADLASAAWPTDMTSLEAIPRLRAAVKEGVRWAGAAAAMLPRITPAGGAVLAGRFIPGGTIISSSPIWYLHDKQAFPSPHTYLPSRWLDQEKANPACPSPTLRDEYYIPFSKGPSTCVGAHFAYLELYISVSQILRNYHISLASPPSPGLMSQTIRHATLPPRREWVAAVPLIQMNVIFESRDGK